jgi:hypothetical protein
MGIENLFLAIIAAGGGGALVALGIVRAFGEKWLDSKFTGRLQQLRHEHERQIEEMRVAGAGALDRAARLSEQEFEVTAEAWSLVFEVYVKTASALPGVRFGVPDFSNLSDDAARRVLEGANFEPWAIDDILAAQLRDRNRLYMERRDLHEIRDAKIANREAAFYLAKKALFLEKAVHERLTAFVNDAWTAIFDWEMVRSMRDQGPPPENFERRDNLFRANSEQRIKELEQFVRERFWPAEQVT